MKKHIFSLLLILLAITTLSSCVFTTTGESLEAFSRRMNELNENYNMTADGYIIDTSESTLTKFFKFNQNDLMLSFKYDNKHRLNEMNIVFGPIILDETPESLTFIENCIKCFLVDEKVEKEILEEADFQNSIKKINMETKSAEVDNIKIEIDTTELGTVISVYKDI